jgi:hypothetical protein
MHEGGSRHDSRIINQLRSFLNPSARSISRYSVSDLEQIPRADLERLRLVRPQADPVVRRGAGLSRTVLIGHVDAVHAGIANAVRGTRRTFIVFLNHVRLDGVDPRLGDALLHFGYAE